MVRQYKVSEKLRSQQFVPLRQQSLKLKKFGTISVIKLIERLKTRYTLRELIFADFADSD